MIDQTNMKLILYHFEGCPYCYKVENALKELVVEGLEHRDILINPAYRDELVSLNGIKQVPCLVVDGKPILESNDIVAFLRAHFPKRL